MSGLKVISSQVNISYPGKMEKSKVCRCLFGPPPRDHDIVRKSLKEVLEKDRRETKIRWNFDIETDEPLPGRYEWIAVDDSEPIPEFYRKAYTSNKVRVHRQNNNVIENNNLNSDVVRSVDPVQRILTFSSSDENDAQSRLEDNSSQNMCNTDSSSTSDDVICSKSSGRLIQSNIDDFLKKRKRPASPDWSTGNRQKTMRH